MLSQASTLRPPTPPLRSSQEIDASINKFESSSQQETPKASTETARPQTASSIRPHCQQSLSEAVDAISPPLRHTGSQSSLKSYRAPSIRNQKPPFASSRPLSVTFLTYEEQRYAGKKVNISHTTKNWNPFATEAVGNNKDVESMDIRNSATLETEATISTYTASDSGNTTLYERPEGGSLDREMRPLTQDEKTRTTLARNEGPIESKEESEEEVSYPGPLGLFILIMGIALSVFLISLDRTIITTAVPYISSEFNSPSEVGWYGSSYLLTASAFQPLYGRVFMFFNMKWTYLVALSMFELGSLICAVAPNSMALIIGRAIAGLGSAGILTGSFVVVTCAVPLNQRPVLTAVVGLMFAVGATVGPLLGGVFTDLVTWRWCFYFNIPVGGVTFVAMFFFFHPPKNHAHMGEPFFRRIMELDLIGNVILLGACIMLFLALQFTEEGKAWKSAEVIGLLAACGLTFILFSGWQWWKGDAALMPPRILGQRTVAASCAAAFFIYSAILIQTYYLPMWFQAIKGVSAIRSGVDMIPYVTSNAFFSVVAGIFVSKNGYFILPAVVGMAIGTIGSGFISTFSINISTAQWVGYEMLASAGIGMAIQQGFTAVQIVLPIEEVAIGTAAVVAFQSLGGAVFISVGNTILQNSLRTASKENKLPGVDIKAVIDAGASDFREKVTAEQLPALLKVYNKALQRVFIAAIPVAALAIMACCFMEMISIEDGKKNKEEVHDEERQRSEIELRKETERVIVSTNAGDTKNAMGGKTNSS